MFDCKAFLLQNLQKSRGLNFKTLDFISDFIVFGLGFKRGATKKHQQNGVFHRDFEKHTKINRTTLFRVNQRKLEPRRKNLSSFSFVKNLYHFNDNF